MFADLLSLITLLAPLNLIARLNAHLRAERGEQVPGPFPFDWTLRPRGPPRGRLDIDIWADRRDELSVDLWAHRRGYLQEPSPHPIMPPDPYTREHILSGLVGRDPMAEEGGEPSKELRELVEGKETG